MKKGFTLIETIVALFVLSIALTGAFSVLIFNLQTSRYIKNAFIASGLAQEGLEVIRNIRDSDWYSDDYFGLFGNPDHQNVFRDGVYRVQYNSTSLIPLDDNPFLKKDTAGIYSYDSNADSKDTIFRRTLEIKRNIQPDGSVPEIILTVRVVWNERFGTKEITGEEHLYDWYKPTTLE